jgi:hypothetical protein
MLGLFDLIIALLAIRNMELVIMGIRMVALFVLG